MSMKICIMEEHAFPYNPNPKTLTWEKLEASRMKRLGLSNKYSRHFNVLRQSQKELRLGREGSFELTNSRETARIVQDALTPREEKSINGKPSANANSVAPFATVGKSTCGYFFSRGTDNKKKNFGITPSNLVKWRNFGSANHGQ